MISLLFFLETFQKTTLPELFAVEMNVPGSNFNQKMLVTSLFILKFNKYLNQIFRIS